MQQKTAWTDFSSDELNQTMRTAADGAAQTIARILWPVHAKHGEGRPVIWPKHDALISCTDDVHMCTNFCIQWINLR